MSDKQPNQGGPHRSPSRPIVGKDREGNKYQGFIYEDCGGCGECYLWSPQQDNVCPTCGEPAVWRGES